MMNMIKKMTLAATVSTFALAGVALAEDFSVSKIDVSASYSGAQDSNAQALWPEITVDMGTALTRQFTMSTDDGSAVVSVDIRKVALDGDTFLPDSKEFNQIEGVVTVTNSSGGDAKTFPVKVAAETDDTTLPIGYIEVSPSTDSFYTAMLDGFAASVADRMKTLRPDGT